MKGLLYIKSKFSFRQGLLKAYYMPENKKSSANAFLLTQCGGYPILNNVYGFFKDI